MYVYRVLVQFNYIDTMKAICGRHCLMYQQCEESGYW